MPPSKRTPAPKRPAIDDLLSVMARLRSPTGCPWDREQDHLTLRFHAVEEVYELMDAIEAGDDHEMLEELGDLLLQVVFHCQMADERKAFDFEKVTRNLVEKLVRRHPHVFGDAKAKDVDAVWAQWEKIKRSEKKGTPRDRASALDGVPRHLPALLRAEKLVKKARKAGILGQDKPSRAGLGAKNAIGGRLFDLVEQAQSMGWSAEELLRLESQRRERSWRRKEQSIPTRSKA
ncbi:MAG TPA: MazG family protein [Verrucomicrobiales bacterium]|nr:MazG family protein [Verrucomicrobiales bacterium]